MINTLWCSLKSWGLYDVLDASKYKLYPSSNMNNSLAIVLDIVTRSYIYIIIYIWYAHNST